MNDMASTSEEGLISRKATVADYEAILSINDDIYGGLDYIPAMLKYYLQCNSYLVYVAEVDGIIRACTIFMKHPGDKRTGCEMAGRSHMDYQSKGLINAITFQAFKELKEYGIEQMAADAFFGTFWKKTWPKYEDTGVFKERRRWKVFMFRCERKSLEKLSASYTDTLPMSLLQNLCYTQAVKITDSSNLIHDVIGQDGDYFQSGNNWLTLPVNTDCIKLALTGNDVIVTWSDKWKSAMEGLSFSSLLPAKCGTRLDIYFYGRETEEFFAHVASHFIRAARNAQTSNIGMMIHFPMALDAERIENVLSEFLGQRFQYFKDEDPTEAFCFTHPVPNLEK